MRRSDGLRSKMNAGESEDSVLDEKKKRVPTENEEGREEAALNSCFEVGADSLEVQSGVGSTHPVGPSPA